MSDITSTDLSPVSFPVAYYPTFIINTTHCIHYRDTPPLPSYNKTGKNPKPEIDNPLEILFMAISWLMGVFVFAILIGNVKDIIAQNTKNQDEYMAIFDALSQYMFG